MDRSAIEQLTANRPELNRKLYCRGFLLTDDSGCETLEPVLKSWRLTRTHHAYLYVHPDLPFYSYGDLVLIGHTYDPIAMNSSESVILRELHECGDFLTKLNQLTGLYTLLRFTEQGVCIYGDPTGMQTVFYTVHSGHYYASSHTMMLGTLLSLTPDPYVVRLASYRFFPLLGNSLPGNLSQFAEVKRLVPNHCVTLSSTGIRVSRFYTPHKLKISHEEIVRQASKLLHANLALIAEKWSKPAISITGGCDSKTTLACANGLYDRFTYFSYSSSVSEKVDAEAAASICTALGLSHTIYWIPDEDELVPGAAETAKILRWNTGDLCNSNPNDVRKRVVLSDPSEFDVEVKSWASEVGRAYYSKRFNGKTDFGPKPTPRACTALYKFFLHNRSLVRETDRVFELYLKSYFRQDPENPIPWQEQFFWEFRMPSWNGLVITGEHRYSFDITIPYNNRLLLELLLSAPLEVCLHDEIHAEIRAKMNPQIDRTGIAVQNVKHTSNRAKLEKLYYTAMVRIPF